MGRRKMTDGRSVYNRMLYNACRTSVDRQHRKNGDLVRARRWAVCMSVTAKTRGGEHAAVGDYEELSIAELRLAINKAGGDADARPLPLKPRQITCASKYALGKFTRSATVCALRYCELDGVRFVWEGDELTGEKLRQKMQSLHDLKIMPPQFYGVLRSLWVNPKANAVLISARLRGDTGRPERLYDHQLTVEECDKLIEYFREIENNSEPVPTGLSNN